MICKEAWYREADERSLRTAYERFSRGDLSAAAPFWREVVRLSKWPEWINYEDVMRTPDEVLETVMPGHRIKHTSNVWTALEYSEESGLSEWDRGDWELYHSDLDWEVDENWEDSGEHPLRYLATTLNGWRHSRSGYGKPEAAAPTIFGDFDSGNPYDVEFREDGGYIYYAQEDLLRIDGPYDQQIADLAWRFAKRGQNQ